jgi:RimJ/RimL family protein N-acetyltransferase
MIIKETERLKIRNFLPDDWKSLQRIVILYQQSKYAKYDHLWPTTDEKMKEIVLKFSAADNFLAVEIKEINKLIGLISIPRKEDTDSLEYNLGYIFDFNHQGKGYAAEACKSIIDYVFEKKGAHAITTGTAKENIPSCRLLEKIGFIKTGENISSFQLTKEGKAIEFIGNCYYMSKEHWSSLNNV